MGGRYSDESVVAVVGTKVGEVLSRFSFCLSTPTLTSSEDSISKTATPTGCDGVYTQLTLRSVQYPSLEPCKRFGAWYQHNGTKAVHQSARSWVGRQSFDDIASLLYSLLPAHAIDVEWPRL